MLSYAKLPKSFWGDTVKTTINIINISPSVQLDGDVLQEVWSGRKVPYNHLKVFGCQAFVHIPRDKRTKLDLKTNECIYLGSPRGEFRYRLWDLTNRKIVKSQDVVFWRTKPWKMRPPPQKKNRSLS